MLDAGCWMLDVVRWEWGWQGLWGLFGAGAKGTAHEKAADQNGLLRSR